jgi:HTH-type transcriptional regulator/antitoxin HigA
MLLLNNTYLELLQSFPPRPITSEAELVATQKVIDSLLDRDKLSADERDYLNLLGTLVYEYEEKQEPIPDIYSVELLKALLDEFGMRQKDLVPVFRTESIISDILKGKRQLSARHIEELAQFFHISPAAFFPASSAI